MKEFVLEVKASWENERQKILAREENVIKICELVLSLTRSTIKKVRDYLLKNGFNNVQEEIWFFKEAHPAFLSQLIYYDKLYHLELRRPVGRVKLVRKFLENEMIHLEHSYENYTDFYFYYRTGQTSLDQEYFTRRIEPIIINYDSLGLQFDPSSSTGYDLKIATILAYDMLLSDLNRELYNLKVGNIASSFCLPMSSNALRWTGSKTGLVELIYALALLGVFNNGKRE
ncbi:MAG: tetracycline regulation of excision, RteC, partial [Daejeonella sp.]|nr:tetracycline regulation of excision, RteC [Daejeonella sp.]